MRDVEVVRVGLEVDAHVGVDGLAGARTVARTLLERARAAELLDRVGPFGCENLVERLEQSADLLSILVALLSRQRQLRGDVGQ
jgi:hypothetical protein